MTGMTPEETTELIVILLASAAKRAGDYVTPSLAPTATAELANEITPKTSCRWARPVWVKTKLPSPRDSAPHLAKVATKFAGGYVGRDVGHHPGLG